MSTGAPRPDFEKIRGSLLLSEFVVCCGYMNIILLSADDICEVGFRFGKNDDRYRHCKKILKLRVGDTFKVGLINGVKGTGTITHFDDMQLRFDFVPNETPPEPLFPITAVLGFPRPIQLKRCLKDMATLGVSNIALVPTQLGEASYLQSDLVQKSEVQKFLLEGASQAGSTLLPEVRLYRSIKNFFDSELGDDRTKDEKIILDVTDNAVPLYEHLCRFQRTAGKKIFLAIGNERGWTDAERTLFSEHGFCSCSMGRRILKTETAVVSSISIVLSTLGLW